jgi:hypothetical protein
MKKINEKITRWNTGKDVDMDNKRLSSSAANLEYPPWLVSRGVVALHEVVGYELSVGSLHNHRQGQQQVKAKISLPGLAAACRESHRGMIFQ